jgi:hypothetical protein
MKLTAKDFERLTDTQMEFKANAGWKDKADRFTDGLDWAHEFIYWAESYASVLLACSYLYQEGFTAAISYDEAVDQYCFTTNYAGSWVNA